MSSKGTRDAINDLGRFFGIRSADAYLAGILNPKDVPMATDPLKSIDLSIRGRILNSLSGAGEASPSIESILKYIETAVGEGIGPDKEKKKAKLKELAADLCITLSSPGKGDPSKHPINAPKVSLEGGDDEMQGLFAPEVDSKYYTVDDFRSKPEKGKDTRTPVHAVQIFPAIGNVAQSDCDVVNLFLNSVPTLELSRAVPYIDILIASRQGSDENETRPMSIGRFLVGRNMTKEDSITKGIFGSEDMALTPDPEDPKALRTAASMEIFTSPQTMVPTNTDGTLRMDVNNGQDDGGGIKPIDPFRPMLSLQDLDFNVAPSGGMHSFKTANMKVILHDRGMLGAVAPLVAPSERGSIQLIMTYGWSHPDGSNAFGPSPAPGRSADAGTENRWGDLINSMRVTETYGVMNSDFSFEEDGSVSIGMKLAMVGAGSLETADITLSEVTDKSGEVNEIFAKIKTALRSYIDRQKAFGKVNITSTMRSATNMRSASAMKKEDIAKLKTWLSNKKKDADISEIHKYVNEVFGEGTNKKPGAIVELNQTLVKVINDMVENLAHTPDPFLRADVGDFKDIVCRNEGKPNKFKDGHTAKISKGKIEKKGKITWNSQHHYISLGKILTYFVGESMATSGGYEEVQVLFYAFNDSASYLHDCNIAQFPINIQDFTMMLIEKFNKNGRMNLTQFMSFLNTYFLRDQGQPGYGFSSIYEKSGFEGRSTKNQRKRDFAASLKTKKGKDGKPKQQAINNLKKSLVAKAYGLDQNSPNCKFKLPQIMMRAEVVPLADDFEGKSTSGKSILKLHIVDQKCNTTSTLMELFKGFAGSGVMKSIKREGVPKSLRGSRHQEVMANQLNILEDEMNVIESFQKPEKLPEGYTEKAVENLQDGMYFINIQSPGRLKNVLMQLAPTLIYGGLHSGIISAKVSSQNNPGLMTVNMLRQSKKGAGTEVGKDTGLPQQVVPTSLDLEVFGCPYINFGQQYFVDLGSNSTADNFYGVVGVSHKIGNSGFTTSVKMVQMDAFGTWVSTLDQVKEVATLALKIEADAQKKEEKK